MNTDMATLTGAYAVDALTGAERDEFEHHLGVCSDCAQEVRELRETATRLGVAEAASPPADLKQRVLSEITRTRQLPPSDDADRLMGLRAKMPRSWGTRLATAAAVVGIVLASAFGVITLRTQDELHDARRQLASGSQRGSEIAKVLAAPDTTMTTGDGAGFSGNAMVSPGMGKTVFMGSAMRTPPPEHVYQLWLIGDYGYVSAGVLSADQNGRMRPVVAAIPPGTAGMGVTIEPDGGSPQPTTEPILHMNTST